MLDFKIIHCGVYRHAERARWRNPHVLISLYVKGLLWRRENDVLQEEFLPGLSIRPQDEIVEYEYGQDRENWVLQLQTSEILPASKPDMVAVRSAGSLISVPRFTPLTSLRVTRFQALFSRIQLSVQDPSPMGQLRARGQTMIVLSHILDRQAEVRVVTPAGQLKRLIDQDEKWNCNLETLSRNCGMSPDYLRRLFFREFGMHPQEYRQQRRLLQAAQLLENTPLQIKEIAARLGFRHVSHFCMVYRRAFGRTPGETRADGPQAIAHHSRPRA